MLPGRPSEARRGRSTPHRLLLIRWPSYYQRTKDPGQTGPPGAGVWRSGAGACAACGEGGVPEVRHLPRHETVPPPRLGRPRACHRQASPVPPPPAAVAGLSVLRRSSHPCDSGGVRRRPLLLFLNSTWLRHTNDLWRAGWLRQPRILLKSSEFSTPRT